MWGDDERLRTLDAIVPVTYYGVGEHNDVIAKTSVKKRRKLLMPTLKVNYGHFYIPTYGDHNILNVLKDYHSTLNDLDRNELAG